MKKIFLLPFLFVALLTHAQDSVKYRIILIGDAGELDKQQNGVLQNAVSNVLKGKTSVLTLAITFILPEWVYPVVQKKRVPKKY
jgi:hypothetical protein